MGRITRLVVAKARTIRPGEGEEWLRTEYTLEAAIEDDAEVSVAKATLEGIIDGWLTGVAKPAPPATLPNIFPKDLADMLVFEETSEWTIVRPRRFLGSENFAKIAAIVKEHKGEYISAGKDSHFRLPKK